MSRADYRADYHVEHLVDDCVHEVLAPADVRRVRRPYCKRCPTCKEALRSARRRLAALRGRPSEPAPEGLIAATLRRLETHAPVGRPFVRRLARVGGAAVAASVLLLVSLHVYYSSLAPTPYDLQVLGQTRLLAGSTAALRVRLMDHFRGVGLAGVPIELTLRGRAGSVKLASFTTDADGYGTPRVQVPDWNEDGCELIVTARPGAASETARRAVRVERPWKLMLSSDKPVYQPGQVIRLRALTLSAFDRKPAAGRPVTFTVTDPKGNVVFKRKGEASRHGIASADCPLADELIEGAYAVRCQVEDTSSALTVEVKRYVLPKFKLEVETDRPFYAPGGSLKATVRGNYFFGKPVAGGSVEVSLRDADGKKLGEPRGKTGAEGKAEFEFALTGATEGQLSLDVTLTDTAGQKQHRNISRAMEADSIRVEVIPEAGRLVRGVRNRVYFLTTTPDGGPVAARLTVTVAHRSEEMTADAFGAATLELQPADAAVEMTVIANGDGGLSGRRTARLEPDGTDADFLLRVDRSVLCIGDTLTLTALGQGREPVFFDILKEGQTLLTQTIPMTDGRGEHKLELPAEMSGTLRLCAYRLGVGGTAVRKNRVLFVRPPDDLSVCASLDRPEYRPGDKARLSLTLTDRQGKPAPGALSLAAVDEAVFSVLSAAPGMEKVFFSTDADLLRVVQARYPLSPDGPADAAERRRLEDAVFAVAGTDAIAVAPHSLTASTFAEKADEVWRTQREGLDTVRLGWFLVLGTAVAVIALTAYVVVWFSASRTVLVAVHALMLLGGCLVVVSPGTIQTATPIVRESIAFDASGSMAEPFWSDKDGEGRDLRGWVLSSRQVSSHAAGGIAAPRLREHFPETLLWRPELITDDNGRVSLDLDLADSITTWRLTASAVTADGRLGAAETPVRVFQPFFVELNLPTHFTRGDEVSVPLVVYSYLDRPQTVELRLDDAPWFERLDEPVRKVELAAGEVKSLSYRLRLKSAGRHELTVFAVGSGVADAVKRRIEVVPDGRRVEHAFNGTLNRPTEVALSVPDNAVEGGTRAILKLYPSGFSQLIEGLDAIFQMPSGCFEQTSSTTYPNVLALDYLGRTGRKSSGVEAKARQYIHLGYQRLLSFEVAGGGFDWFGRPPANVTLTAYGLMEFRDMARVHDVDPNLIARTRRWLLDKRGADGSWAPEGHGLHDDPTQRGDDARLASTAYVAWAVFEGGDADARPTRDWLLRHRPDAVKDAHTLALVCNALLACGAADEAKPYLDRLIGMKQTSEDGDQVSWELGAGKRTTFHGSGRGGNVETTALAALALLRSGHAPADATRALSWLARQKDARGTWHSTQATVLALKALLAGTAAEPEGERRVEIAWQGGSRTAVIPPDQAEVMQTLDLSTAVASGARRFTLSERGNAATGYQLSFRYHVPVGKTDANAPLSLELTYDRTELTVGDVVKATAKVTNRSAGEAPMLVLELPAPPGFAVMSEDFTKLVEAGTVAKWQSGPGGTVVYLRSLGAGKSLTLPYRLRALMPVKVTAAAGRAYEYYDSDCQAHSAAIELKVSARP